MANTGDFVFQSFVEHENKPHILSVTKWQLLWECTSKHRISHSRISEPLIEHDACLDLREVIGIKPIKIPPKASIVTLRKRYKVDESAPVCIEMQSLGPFGFSVYVITRPGNHKWRYKQVSFQCKDSNLSQQWVSTIKELLKSPEFNRPQKLIVFLNPLSGHKKAAKIYKEKVQSLFDLADINVTLIETERQNHARDMVKHSLDLTGVDGLIVVGGDGIFGEVLNGLLTRTMEDTEIEESNCFEHLPANIRIGLVPAGSTNTIVYTTTGLSDVITSVLHIVLGDSIGIDVSSVNVNDKFVRYSVTMLGYGYMGDLLKDSDKNRWMGPTRYQWAGTKVFLAHNSYYGEVKYRLSSNSDSHPADEVKCVSGCETCYQVKEEPYSCSSKNVSVDFSADGEDPDTSVSSDWQSVIGKFVAVNSVTMSCSCHLSPTGMSPFCHLGDGCMDLIIVSDCSRRDFLKFLVRTANGIERDKLEFMQTHRVKEFTFRPLTEDSDLERISNGEELSDSKKVKLKRQTSRTSVWNCDGEVINNPTINVRVHCQLVKLFARGVEDLNTTQEQGCKLCCSTTVEKS